MRLPRLRRRLPLIPCLRLYLSSLWRGPRRFCVSEPGRPTSRRKACLSAPARDPGTWTRALPAGPKTCQRQQRMLGDRSAMLQPARDFTDPSILPIARINHGSAARAASASDKPANSKAAGPVLHPGRSASIARLHAETDTVCRGTRKARFRVGRGPGPTRLEPVGGSRSDDPSKGQAARPIRM
jgi:hypothetical protein